MPTIRYAGGMVTLVFVIACSEPAAPAVAPAISQYEVVGRKMLNDTRILEVRTDAAISQLSIMATEVINNEPDRNPFMVRVFFYFPNETPGQSLPRYLVEQSGSGRKLIDFTEQRKIAELPY